MKKAQLFFIVSTVIMVILTFCIFLYTCMPNTPLAMTQATITSINQSGRMNINTATVAQLETLPGIGTKLAKAIVAYRAENGAFESVGDLANVPGIGAGKLNNIADLITVGG